MSDGSWTSCTGPCCTARPGRHHDPITSPTARSGPIRPVIRGRGTAMTTGYAKQQSIALENASPEQTLAWGLTTTARRMASACDPGATRDQILDAVRVNWRLWTIIQVEQTDPDCATPKAIREGL